MKVLVIGLGSAGRRHLANLRLLDPAAEVAVLRRKGGPGEKLPAGVGIARRMEEAVSFGPEAAIIASPASLHVEDAVTLAYHGVHLLVEKPLSDSLDGVDKLLAECRRRSLVLMTGYNLRFHEPLRILRAAVEGGAIGRILSIRAEVGQYLPDWRPSRDYRQGVSARAELGGGVVLELSHELDYVRWLAGDVGEVFARTGRLGDLEIDVEDTAEILLRFAGGALGSVHLDMVQRPYSRGCRIIGAEGTATWDGVTDRVSVWTAGKGAWSDLHPAGTVERNASFLSELRHFLDCVRTGSRPLVSGEEGRKTLEVAMAVKASSRAGRPVELTQPMRGDDEADQ